MARRLSWIDRLHPIARAVGNSARSHYDRKDLEKLFELQPRAAQLLMSALPTIRVGRAKLVEKEALSRFLDQLQQAEDPAKALAHIREGKDPSVRRKLRSLVLRDVDTKLDTLPANIHLSRGEMRVTFRTADQLAEAMMHLASVMTHQLEDFAKQYEELNLAAEVRPTWQVEEEAELAYFREWGSR